MDIKKVTDKIMLGNANECTYIARVEVERLQRGVYSKINNEVLFYKIEGKVSCRELSVQAEEYNSKYIFVSKKMFNVVEALNKFQEGILYIVFDVHVIRGEESRYDIISYNHTQRGEKNGPVQKT